VRSGSWPTPCKLPFDDKRFDLAVCQFGVMFFPDKPAAFREVRRVLTPRGRLLFSTWGTVDSHGFAAALAAEANRTESWIRSPSAGRGAARRLY